MLAFERRAAANGVYDIHTNLMHYPRNTQPTHARWERSADPLLSHPSSTVEEENDTLFRPLPSTITNNFAIIDTHYVSPAMPDMPYPGPDGDVMDDYDTSLSSVREDILDLLDEQQRQAFEEARKAEQKWRGMWGTESEDGLRGELVVSYNS